MRFAAAGKHSAPLLAQALLVLQPTQFLGRIDGGLTVGANAQKTAPPEKAGGGEEPVAEIGLGADGDAHGRCSSGEPLEFVAGGVRGMDEAPMLSEQSCIEQQLDR